MVFKEFMKDERGVNRWFILRVGLVGVLCGVALAFMWFALAAVGK
jgi:hypothetical protein